MRFGTLDPGATPINTFDTIFEVFKPLGIGSKMGIWNVCKRHTDKF